jgi:hypothetical protein
MAMPKKNENYMKNPSGKLIQVLSACHWEPVGFRMWEKGTCRLFVDELGIFLYQLQNSKWVRTHGLTFTDFQPRYFIDYCICFKDQFRLNLAEGKGNVQ